ncbi:hypothetical protein M3699_14345 [Peribacillus simplex]|uniref:hypothetical protein n=1 Tax=Peribacillus simplex TaxID=1478 RepID=UPI00203AA734|nr:hypothetical protein [Peribacillus simplex]MCM3675034.1 hypothetical protein [Peribacillus simplex]
MNLYLGDLMNLRSSTDIVEYIRNIYVGVEDIYIPALISEGNYIRDLEADFYLKLIIKHKEIPIKKTWLLDNLQYSLPTEYSLNELDKEQLYELFTHNLIVYRNHKNSSVYQVNPLMTTSEAYQEHGVKNLRYVEAYFSEEYLQNKGDLVLEYTKKEKDEYLNILKNFLKEFIIYKKDEKWGNSYELIAEFEYRNKNHNSIKDNYKNTNEGFIEYSHSEKHGLYLRGSIKVPFEYSISNKRAIKVIDLGSKHVREHNPENYNGDTEEGFIAFSSDVINILKQDYFFYDIQMIEKENPDNTVLVDYMENKVVFWEAEYNKLSIRLKNKIDDYNIIPNIEKESIISKAMASMQLEASWNWDKELEPDKKLAYLIKSQMFEKAVDMNMNFLYPQNINQLKGFILQIEKLTSITLEQFNVNAKEVQLLIDIRADKEIESMESEKITDLYLKYCYAIGRILEGGN